MEAIKQQRIAEDVVNVISASVQPISKWTAKMCGSRREGFSLGIGMNTTALLTCTWS